MNNDNSTFDFEDRTYINPDLSRDEQTQFIETLRGMQDRNAQEIGRETYALGTNVPSNLGGLGGAEETWNARYQEPQMNEVAAQLKTAAQQTALNNALSNYSNMLQNRYNQAYRDYQKRAYSYSRKNSGGSGGNTGGTGDNGNKSTWDGEPEKEAIDTEKFYGIPETKMTEDDQFYYYEDPNTGETTKVSKEYMNKLYGEDGRLTDDGQVILNTRQLLGL